MTRLSSSIASSVALLVAGVGMCACAVDGEGTVDDPEPLAQATSAHSHGHHGQSRTQVIFDTDMDFDDATALAYLCEQHKAGEIELLAVTVDNNGVGYPGQAIRHARCVLSACGLPSVPVADGSNTGTNTPSDLLRGAIDGVLEGAFASCTASAAPSAKSASQVIVETVLDESDDCHGHGGQLVVVTTGPFSNLSAALQTGPQSVRTKVRNGIDAVYSLAGALAVPGNVNELIAPGGGFDGSQEVNVWIDPASAQSVLDRLSPNKVRLVPLDAANDVPITQQYVAEIGANQGTPGASVVYSIMSQPTTVFGVSLGLFYWWDPLNTVVAVSDEEIVEFESARVRVVQSGPSQGRTVLDSHGARVRATYAADQSAFEDAFLAGLNGQ